MKRLFVIFALLCGSAFGQTFFTDCAGIDGTPSAGVVVCPNLPAGYTSAFNTKAVVDWTYPNQPSATVFTVSASANSTTNGTNLQAAINTARVNCGSTGYIVVVPSGFVYLAPTGPPNSFQFQQTNCTAGHYVVLQTDHLTSLQAQGFRVLRSDAVNMPKLTNNLTGDFVVLVGDAPTAVPQAYWFAGIEVVNGTPSTSGAPASGYFGIGDGCNVVSGPGCPITSGMTKANLVNNIHLDRIYAHANNCTGASTDDANRWGIDAVDAWNISLSDSIIDCVVDTTNIGGSNTQSQVWAQDQTPGPTALVNNELRGGTETIAFGFSNSAITCTPGSASCIIPSDLYIEGNYIHKWNTSFWQSYTDQRNWLECKSCQRLLAEGNLFDTDRGEGNSYALQFTPRNGSGSCTWCVVQDITIRYNKMANFADFIAIIGANNDGHNSLGPELPSKRFNIHDNIAEGMDYTTYVGSGVWIGITDGMSNSLAECSLSGAANCNVSDISATHNTFASGLGSLQANKFLGLGTPPVTGGKAFHINISNNIGPAGANLFSSDPPCNTIHPITTAIDCQWSDRGSGSTFDANVITGIVAAGFDATYFPGPNICNFSNSVGNSCPGGNPGWATAMSNVGFANYNSGSGGDYHLCITSSVPSPCSLQSLWQDLASDSLKDNTKEGPSPGANIDAVNMMTANALAGRPTIQAVTHYGPVQGQFQEMRQWVKFPGYFDMGIADGSGKADFSGYNSGNDSESWAGLEVFHDLQHDPGALINLSGANVGLKDNDYTLSTGSICGASAPTHLTDTKAFWGQVSLLSVNNVRAIYKYRGPLIDNNNNHVNVCGNTSVMWNYLWTMGRPGFVNTRYSFDNGSGGNLVFYPFQTRMSTSTYTFNRIAEADQQYPPSYGAGYSDHAFQVTHCLGTVPPADYDPGAGEPWGFLAGSPGGWMMHSITSTIGSAGFVAGVTDGYTTRCVSGDTRHYPITAEFLNIEYDNSGAVDSSNYHILPSGGGARSSLDTPTVTIGHTGTDDLIWRTCGWYGDLAIRNSTNANELAAECQTPSNPTMNAGTSPSFNHDYGHWAMTADATPKVDFTTTHIWTSPYLCIAGWNSSAPNISISGIPQTPNVNFVSTTNDGSGDSCSDSTHLLVQLVGLPTNGAGGMVQIPSGSRIVVTAGPLSNNGSTQPGGQRKIGGGAKIGEF